MSTTVEGENPTVEVQMEEVVVAEQSQPAEKPVKEKKPRVPKEKKPRAPKIASHPPYFQYMEEEHKPVLPENFRKILGLQLKNSAAKGKLIKIKASYKLSEAGKKDNGTTKAPMAEKKPKQVKSTTTAARAGAPNTRSTKKKSETEKKTAKKVGPKKAKKATPGKPKQLKSIKSPAAKRARKAAKA
ncbi:hypothetical protein TEA_005465 [Camellia sinensis var. sinensis]|uniref:H15 domain-containing protein n=1 Tax=Camellia sinensis var. sinensis TaxID=542762 RepID=A0A4S4EAP0_CAMSN|nr:hypothetical protein TEA_005465 [Camellia sinensis var. sinensis]